MMYLVSFLGSFCSVFFKTFQTNNIVGKHLKRVFITSYFMAMFDFLMVYVIITKGWPAIITAGTGGGIGAITAICFHDWMGSESADRLNLPTHFKRALFPWRVTYQDEHWICRTHYKTHVPRWFRISSGGYVPVPHVDPYGYPLSPTPPIP